MTAAATLTPPTRIGRIGRFLWAAWAGIAALSLFAALWSAAHRAYGGFILPDPLATLVAAGHLLGEEKALFSRMDGQLEPDTKESHSGHLLYG